MAEAAKKRTQNFTETEKNLLIDLVNENKEIIENKHTNNETTFMKEKCWEEIAKKFNSVSSYSYRSVKSLKNCWENIKKRTRKHYAEEQKELYKTDLAKSKTELSENLLKNEQERHAAEMALAERKLIKEDLEIEIKKMELQIKKAILIRETSNNELRGISN